MKSSKLRILNKVRTSILIKMNRNDAVFSKKRDFYLWLKQMHGVLERKASGPIRHRLEFIYQI